MKPNRSEPCPCGSGLKLKNCCYIKGKADPGADLKLLELKKSLIPRLLEYLLKTHGQQSIEKAWQEFNGDLSESDLEYDPLDSMNTIFLPWLLFNWCATKTGINPQPWITVTDSFIKSQQENLSTDELSVLKAANKRPYTYYEVLEVSPGSSLKLLDLFQQAEFQVHDKTASKVLEKAEIILCATMLPVFEKATCIAIGPVPIPSILKHEIMELREEILKKYKISCIDEETLQKESSLVIGYYLDLVEALQGEEHEEDEDINE